MGIGEKTLDHSEEKKHFDSYFYTHELALKKYFDMVWKLHLKNIIRG